MGRPLAIQRFIAILLPTALLTVTGIVFAAEALPMDASLRYEPGTDIIRLATSSQAFPKYSVRRTGAQEVTAVFTESERDALKTSPDVRASKLIAGIQPTSQGFKIKLKTKAFGCVSLPISGGSQLEIHIFSDAIGARWVDTAKAKAPGAETQTKDRAKLRRAGDGARASPVVARTAPPPPRSAPEKPTLTAGTPMNSARDVASRAPGEPGKAVGDSPPPRPPAAPSVQAASVFRTMMESSVAYALPVPASGVSSLRIPVTPNPSAPPQAVQTGRLAASAAFTTVTFPDFFPLPGMQSCGSPVIFGRAGPRGCQGLVNRFCDPSMSDPRQPFYLLWNSVPLPGREGWGVAIAIPSTPLACAPSDLLLRHQLLGDSLVDIVLHRIGPRAFPKPEPPKNMDEYPMFLEEYALYTHIANRNILSYFQCVPQSFALMALALLESAPEVLTALPVAPEKPVASVRQAKRFPTVLFKKRPPARVEPLLEEPRELLPERKAEAPIRVTDSEQLVREPRFGNERLLAWLKDLVATHPAIQAAEAGVEAAEHLHGRAKSRLFPSLDAKFELGHERIKKTAQDTSLFRKAATLAARQLIHDFGGTAGNIGKAAADRDVMATRLTQVRQNIILQGITAYMNVLRTREMALHAKMSVQSVQRKSGIQEALVERGVALSFEALQMKAQLNGAQANLYRAERDHAAALHAFTAVFSHTPSAEVVQELEYPRLDKASLPEALDGAIEAALKQHPQMVEVKQLQTWRKAELQRRESALFPKLDALIEGLGKDNDAGEAGRRTEGRASLQFNWNLFSGNRDSENVKAAKADILTLLRAEKDRRRTVEAQTRNTWAQMLSAGQRLRINQTQSELLKAYLRQIEETQMTGVDVKPLSIIIAERDFLTANDQATAARIDAELGQYTLLMHMGMLNLEILARQ